MDTIIRAQSLLVAKYDVTSETALGLLVWTADSQSQTVAEVAIEVCHAIDEQEGDAPAAPLLASA